MYQHAIYLLLIVCIYLPANRVVSDKNMMVGSWAFTFKILDGIETPFRDSFTFTLKPDDKFESLNKPHNYHTGQWEIYNDTLEFRMKGISHFKVLELTDSSMVLEDLYLYRKHSENYRFSKK